MKIDICDVCYKNKTMVSRRYRIGFKGSIKMDVCEKHHDFLKGLSLKEATKKYLKLFED